MLEVECGDIRGRFDRLDTQQGATTVIDYKTGNPRSLDQLKRDLQVRGYAAALWRQSKADNVAVELHWLQTAEVTRVEFDDKALRTAYAHVEGSARELSLAVQMQEFPAKPNGWKCQRCDYRTICDEAAQG